MHGEILRDQARATPAQISQLARDLLTGMEQTGGATH
jgi:hypothetical protein